MQEKTQGLAESQSNPVPPAVAAAIAEVEASPGDEGRWERLEEAAEGASCPEAVEALYVKVIEAGGELEQVERLAMRAARYHDEWAGEGALLERILMGVLRVDAGVGWAFERLTMLLTMSERWSELLGLYDRILASTTDLMRRRELLDEAAHVAKDFAGQPDRAIDYLWQIFLLRPSDAGLAVSLERLLESRGRHRELAKLWEARLGVLGAEAGRALRLRAAQCWLEQVGDAAEAVKGLEVLLSERFELPRVVAMLERVAVVAGAPEASGRAYGLLELYFEGEGRAVDVLRVIEGALGVVTPAARPRLHRKAAGLYEGRGAAREALRHQAALLGLLPADDEALSALRRLGEETGEIGRVAEALAGAAEALGSGERAVALREEAAGLLADRVGDQAGAARLMLQVFRAEEAGDERLRRVGEKLWRERLLKPGQEAELLPVLERLVELGPRPEEADPESWRRELLGEAALVARGLGAHDRALRAWELRLEADPADQAAIDGQIDALEGLKRWEPLVAALRGRAERAASEGERRRDLVRIAKVVAATVGDTERAIASWREIEANFGREDGTVDALADLYEQAEKWADLEVLLVEAEGQLGAGPRRSELRSRLGELLRLRKQDAAAACEQYLASLSDEPSCERARAGLWALIEQGASVGVAVSGLVDACYRVDDWRELLRLTEHRLRVAPDEAARAAVLVEAASIQETRGGDAAAALTLLGRALEQAPSDAGIEKNLLRLAGATAGWAEVAGALRRALVAAEAQGEIQERTRELRMRLGDVLERKLGDLPQALASYRAVLAGDPTFPGAVQSVLRAGARLEQFDEVASVLAAASARAGRIEQAWIDEIETSTGPWEPFLEALARALGGPLEGSPEVERELLRKAGGWYQERLGDLESAERALLRAASLAGPHEDTLWELAQLQRRRPDASLIDTLRRLSGARGGDLDALHEAALVALDQLDDRGAGVELLGELLRVGRELWARGEQGGAARPPRWFVAWAIDRWVALCDGEGDAERAISLLVDGARLPFERAGVIALLHRAAEIALARLGDLEKSASLHRDVLQIQADEPASLAQLAEIYRRQGRLDALADLRRHELSLSPPLDRRLVLRLDLAHIASALGDGVLRAEVLRENLREAPGHGESIREIEAALGGGGRHRELAALLLEQADLLEQSGDAQAARRLWLRGAEIAEAQLADVAMAIGAQRRAVAIEETPDALDALARLYSTAGEPAGAIPWLERRLTAAQGGERPEIVLRLAQALSGAARAEEARGYLEAELARDPKDRAVRSQLAALYRGAQAWPSLVSLALTATDQEDDIQAKLGLYLEAADALLRHLKDPARAVELLRRASALAPQDRGLRTGLADALRAAGQLDEAQRLLEGLLEEFGRKRPPERAGVHYQLALLAQARGDIEGALSQLDTASSMDMTHAGVLSLLGSMARDAGQLERAERAYRALLLTLRRQRPDSPAAHAADIGQSEVSFELSRIATRLNQPERSAELLESAFATSAQSPSEAARLERAIRASGEPALLLRALVARRERARTRAEEADSLVEMASVHQQLGQHAEAFEALSSALSLAPSSDGAHQAARALARQANLADRYAQRLRDLAASQPPPHAAPLWIRLGLFHEQDTGDLGAAIDAYSEALAHDDARVEAYRALDRVCARSGDRPRQIGALRALVDLLADEPDPTEHIGSLYRLAALELAAPDSEAQGVASLQLALDRQPRLPEALALLRDAASRSSAPGLLDLYERVARKVGDDGALLDALERLSALPDADASSFREAISLADRLAQPSVARSLLERAASGGPAGAPWAMIELARRLHEAGDHRGAYAWYARAAEFDDDEAFAAGLAAAGLAAGPLNNPTLATQLYERSWRLRPGARAAWEPLLALLRPSGDEDSIDSVLAAAAAATEDPTDRRRLRMERVELLMASVFRHDDSIGVLQEMLDEDPADSDAQGLLLGIYERSGRSDDLAQLLSQQLESARARGALDEIATLSLRLGGLLARRRRPEAMAVYRAALRQLPDDRVLLREFLQLFGEQDDRSEMASVMERLLRHEVGADASRLAAQLADLRESLHDDPAAEAALLLGVAQCPEDDALRARLERFYTERLRWPRLVELLVNDAAHLLDPHASAAKLRKAAAIERDQIKNPRAAADLLRRARSLSADDPSLLHDLVGALLAAGDPQSAQSEVAAALEDCRDKDRPPLLRSRAAILLQQGKENEAVADLEQALSLGDQGALADLSAALEQLRQSSARRSDAAAERAATLRLSGLWRDAGQAERGVELLWQWIGRVPGDLDALRSLLALEAGAGHWPKVIDLCNRLLAADPGEGRVEAALLLADACAQEGRPDDARYGLEQAFAAYPKQAPVRERLKKLYEQAGAKRELADLYLHEAADLPDDAARFEPYRRAAELYLAVSLPTSAIPALEAALRGKPGDHDCTIALADAYTAANQFEQATGLLEAAINAHKNKRSPQLSILQHRMARIALAAGDRNVEMAWLNVALDSDSQNGQVAAELADVATELGQYDIALKALRAVAMMKNPLPMGKGMAYYRQCLIAYHQGDQRKAVLLAKRGLQEEPSLAEARTFLEQLGEKV